MFITEVIVFQGQPQRPGSREAAKNAKGKKPKVCGLARIHILTLYLRGFASSREPRSPPKPPATARFCAAPLRAFPPAHPPPPGLRAITTPRPPATPPPPPP